jgi:hypothetical protein
VTDKPLLTRRRYLLMKACMSVPPREATAFAFIAAEAVATTAMEHPEWDMDEERTWAEWEVHDE